MSNTVFITGATGNIGGKLLITILDKDPNTRIIALIRGESAAVAQNRFEQVLRVLSPEFDTAAIGSRIRVICGDITQYQLGLSDAAFDKLASEVTHIIHSAAGIQFTLPLDCARQVNFVGTINVMSLAQRAAEVGQLRNVAYISTAYVCGDRDGWIYEDESVAPQRFSNTYEQTKFEAEQYVRTLMPALPITILRPSIVVGDSQTGRTLTFNVLYSPLKFIYKGIIKALTCDPATPLDVVPLDYGASAAHYILFRTEPTGKTFHIVAGAAAPAVGSVVRHFLIYLGQNLTGMNGRVPSLDQSNDGRITGNPRTLQLMAVFDPYLKVTRHFDNSNTLTALQGSGITLPPFTGYFDKLLDYCFAVNWGRTLRHAA
ncbi:MAG: SDR family oxidoreductase [candidate division Zixibacteria bacterium]|nr:SDR family oxidoreductase [candidate division Zixibacteria bacterium]